MALSRVVDARAHSAVDGNSACDRYSGGHIPMVLGPDELALPVACLDCVQSVDLSSKGIGLRTKAIARCHGAEAVRHVDGSVGYGVNGMNASPTFYHSDMAKWRRFLMA